MVRRAPINQALLQRIANNVPALIALYNISSGEYIYVNEMSRKILGYSPEEIMSGGLQLIASLVHPEDLTRINEENQAALVRANSQARPDNELIASFSYRMRHKDGGWRWLHTDGTVFDRDDHGKVKLILNVSLDITAQKETEQRLSRSLHALENALKV